MTGCETALQQLLELTESAYMQAQSIQSKMENNEAEQLEALQSLFDRREEVIQQLSVYTQQPNFKWTEKDKAIISKLEQYEEKLQPLITGLHRSFSTQMNRISQTKQMSKKYIGAYQNTASNGSFIDKRK